MKAQESLYTDRYELSMLDGALASGLINARATFEVFTRALANGYRYGVVTVVGFATDHCVKATVLDARALGFYVNVALDLCAGVDPETTRLAISTMSEAGITFAASSDP